MRRRVSHLELFFNHYLPVFYTYILPCLSYNVYLYKSLPKSNYKKKKPRLFSFLTITICINLIIERLLAKIFTTKLIYLKLKGKSYKRTKSFGLMFYKSLYLINLIRAILVKKSFIINGA